MPLTLTNGLLSAVGSQRTVSAAIVPFGQAERAFCWTEGNEGWKKKCTSNGLWAVLDSCSANYVCKLGWAIIIPYSSWSSLKWNCPNSRCCVTNKSCREILTKKQIQEEMNSVTNTVDETNNSVVRFPFPFPLLLSSPFKGMAAERQKSTS